MHLRRLTSYGNLENPAQKVIATFYLGPPMLKGFNRIPESPLSEGTDSQEKDMKEISDLIEVTSIAPLLSLFP